MRVFNVVLVSHDRDDVVDGRDELEQGAEIHAPRAHQEPDRHLHVDVRGGAPVAREGVTAKKKEPKRWTGEQAKRVNKKVRTAAAHIHSKDKV